MNEYRCECGGVIVYSHTHEDEQWIVHEMYQCSRCKKYYNKEELLE